MAAALVPDDVVFMYAAKDESVYSEYGATFSAWGGAHTREKVESLRALGVRSTGTMWCLTAGARALHESEELREAVCRDVAGEPIAVPWLPDHVHEGTPSWFGCTNHPAFRAHVRAKVREAMAGGADGLHVDDHLGSANPAMNFGGCFCRHCMRAFADHLVASDSPALRAEAGVRSFEGFDYLALVREVATTREECLARRGDIPLHREFVDCQLRLAAENTRELGALAAEVAGHPVTLSANCCLPDLAHVVVTPHLTHVIGEVGHHPAEGTRGLLNAVKAYRMAETIGRPIAATAHGTDWAFVKERGCESLVKLWIALSYACGQRLMAPHHMWCFTPEKGTHWYDGPTAAYAPLYRFVRSRRELFRATRTAGPLAPPFQEPGAAPASYGKWSEREALAKALAAPTAHGDPRPLEAEGGGVWVFPRAPSCAAADMREGGGAVCHLVNLDYDAGADEVRPRKGLEVRLPDSLLGRPFERATAHSFDAEPAEVALARTPGAVTFTVPEVRTWAVVELG